MFDTKWKLNGLALIAGPACLFVADAFQPENFQVPRHFLTQRPALAQLTKNDFK